jgi:hypothetical protein
MERTFICQACNTEKPANVRLKGKQKFCGEVSCQRVRKAQWQSRKMQTDPVYRAQQLDCLKRWRKERPLDRYQHWYRQTHLEYLQENRSKQRVRNGKRPSKAPGEMIVKMDALSQIESDTYIMRPLAAEKIVKMDTLVVQLKVLQNLSRPPGIAPG